MNLEQVRPPSFLDSHHPKCPECNSPLFYVGTTIQFENPIYTWHKLFQCADCRILFRQVEPIK